MGAPSSLWRGWGTDRGASVTAWANRGRRLLHLRRRRFGLQPRVAPQALPWVRGRSMTDPNGVVARPFPALTSFQSTQKKATTPLGLLFSRSMPTQGSRCASTLGWKPQRLRR